MPLNDQQLEIIERYMRENVITSATLETATGRVYVETANETTFPDPFYVETPGGEDEDTGERLEPTIDGPYMGRLHKMQTPRTQERNGRVEVVADWIVRAELAYNPDPSHVLVFTKQITDDGPEVTFRHRVTDSDEGATDAGYVTVYTRRLSRDQVTE